MIILLETEEKHIIHNAMKTHVQKAKEVAKVFFEGCTEEERAEIDAAIKKLEKLRDRFKP